MFTIFSYVQPVNGPSIRCGIVSHIRDTYADPVGWSKYRICDSEFQKSQHLFTVCTLKGPRAFYGERVNWRISIPFIGSVLKFFRLFK